MLTVFCPPLHVGEGRSETNERQSKLRANLDIFVENLTVSEWIVIILTIIMVELPRRSVYLFPLQDTTSLSLLLAALARVWNLLEVGT